MDFQNIVAETSVTTGYEIGLGTWDAASGTLIRTSIENRSNGDAAVNKAKIGY